jgi:hypothetical protein
MLCLQIKLYFNNLKHYKMDVGTSLTGLIFLLFCVIIFVILSRSNRKREKQLLHLLKGLAAQNNCKIMQHDTWNNAAIGIDNTTNRLFAIRHTGNNTIPFQVDLYESQQCRVINTRNTGSNKEGNFGDIEKIELAFTYREKNKPETIFDFYNTASNTASLNGELQLAEKWCKITNDRFALLSLKK